MNINDIKEEDFVDIFATPGQEKAPALITPKFGMQPDNGNDIFSPTTTIAPTTGETTTVAPTTGETTTAAPLEDVDLFKDDANKAGRKPKYDFTDAVGYFEDRVKNGKFVAVEEEVDGIVKPFIPKTPEEFDEFIEIQVDTKLQAKEKQAESSWYNNKSQAWKAVAKYAEMVENPEEMLPFLQGVQNIESVKDLDESNLEAAERIVRIGMSRRGETQDMIDDQVESLKTTDKLVATATKYKPLIIKEETQYLQGMIRERQEQEVLYNQQVQTIRDNVIKAVEAPIFGKLKLKNDEKSAVFNLIGLPSQDGGYGIYNKIDSLFQTGKFDVLTKLALLLEKEESLLGYVSATAADKTAEGLQRKLKLANEGKGGAGDNPEKPQPIVQRNQFSNKPVRFGR